MTTYIEAIQSDAIDKLQAAIDAWKRIDSLIQSILNTSGSPTIPEVHNITFDPIGGRDGKAVGPGRTGRHVISGPAGGRRGLEGWKGKGCEPHASIVVQGELESNSVINNGEILQGGER